MTFYCNQYLLCIRFGNQILRKSQLLFDLLKSLALWHRQNIALGFEWNLVSCHKFCILFGWKYKEIFTTQFNSLWFHTLHCYISPDVYEQTEFHSKCQNLLNQLLMIRYRKKNEKSVKVIINQNFSCVCVFHLMQVLVYKNIYSIFLLVPAYTIKNCI